MKKLFLTLVLVSLLLQTAIGQDKTYAKEVINRLSSAEFMGRGYVDDHDVKVAEFIKTELKNNNVSKLAKSYFQPVCLKTYLASIKTQHENYLFW